LSKNFELLQRAQREQEALARPRSRDGAAPLASRAAAPFTSEEAVRLVQRLFLVPGPDAPRVVVFAGVDPGDGCSTVCVRVAETLTSDVGLSGSSCLIDANLRAPALHRYFSLPNRMGLVDAISQPGSVRNFTQQVNGGKLWVMPAGLHTTNVHALLTSESLQERIAELRSEFDNVLIDAPAINPYADACALGKLSDGMILVLQSNATRRESARKAKEMIEVAQVRLLGAVLNKRTFPIPAGIYGKL
jgi:protein-tyrosine kinase